MRIKIFKRYKLRNKLYKLLMFFLLIYYLFFRKSKQATFYECEPILRNSKQSFVEIDGDLYPKFVPLHLNQTINFTCLNMSKKIKKIFLWNKFFNSDSYEYGLGYREPFLRHNCPVTNCELINNRTRLNESDYVLVHMRDSYDQLPTYPERNLKQKWIFVLYESPHHSSTFSAKIDDYFNLTSTYRLDSHFGHFYETYSQISSWNSIRNINSIYNERFDYLNEKKYFAAAVISNCNDKSKRLNLIQILKHYIQIDIYGDCGKPCPTKYFSDSNKNGTCKDVLSKEYKFYLAFENSLCKDYVTEKLFTILKKYPIIPVVYGGANYKNYVRFSMNHFRPSKFVYSMLRKV